MEQPLNPFSTPSDQLSSRGEILLPIQTSKTRTIPYFPLFLILAGISTFSGFFFGWNRAGRADAAKNSVGQPDASLYSTARLPGVPGSWDEELQMVISLPAQQQAERLLQFAMQDPEQSVDYIYKSLGAWRGHLEGSDSLFHLVLEALESKDERVRTVALEIDLAANNLLKSPQSIKKLLREIRSSHEARTLALWRLGELGNRGVEPRLVLSTLNRYAHDKNSQTRFWAVEGLAMLGTRASIEPLISILTHDSSADVRERAAVNLARSGMLTTELRMSAVPQLLNFLDDDSLNDETHSLVSRTLEAITHASLGDDTEAWRGWWAHHDRPDPDEHSHAVPGLTQI
jgi:hypothetical protein